MSDPHGDSSMLREIREQGALLTRGLPRWREAIAALAERARGKRLHLAGCGDMYFAAAQTAALSETLGARRARAWRSMDLRWSRHLLGPDDLVVGASISGRTPRTVEALLLARKKGALTLAITDNAGSPVALAADEALVLGTATAEELEDEVYAGYRHIIAQTQTFLAVLLVELELLSALSGIPLATGRIPERVGRLVDDLEPPVRELAPRFFADGSRVVLLGSGPFRPAALYGGAKFMEFAVPSAVQCLEEFNHLEAFVSGAETRIVMLAGDEPSRDRAAELAGPLETLGARSLVLSQHGPFEGRFTEWLALPEGDLPQTVLALLIAEQLLAAHGVAALGRDPNCWLGGRRPNLIQELSNRTIRGSRVFEAGDAGSVTRG